MPFAVIVEGVHCLGDLGLHPRRVVEDLAEVWGKHDLEAPGHVDRVAVWDGIPEIGVCFGEACQGFEIP